VCFVATARAYDAGALDAQVVAPAEPPPPVEPPAIRSTDPAGTDFVADARMLMQIAACIGDAPMPPEWPALLLRTHCDALRDLVERYRKRWIERTRELLVKVVPADLPKRIVYPFGGGDMVTALHAFPAAEEYTTISLEGAGDIRNLQSLDQKRLAEALQSTRDHLRCLFAVSHSKTTNLREGARSALAGEITFALVAFSVFDFEPTSLRYFRLDRDGNIVYLHKDDLASKESGANPFANVEITFRARHDSKAPVRVYRHFRANLDDKHFTANHPLAYHLRAKGQVAALVKAASYLLWFGTFSHVRTYLLDHATLMLSDSTGVQPSLANAAGFEQECWGLFHGPFLPQPHGVKDEFLAFWRQSSHGPLPYYFGYPDSDEHGHMMVTRRVPAQPPKQEDPLIADESFSGKHWRLSTPKGPVHVFQPRGYDPATAGIVLYVHGYYTTIDKAWGEHALAEQFATSRVNALFVAPEAPSGSGEAVSWPVLGDLLAEVKKQLSNLDPKGPIVATGHSGAWRTLGLWADAKADGETGTRQVDNFIILDGLYGLDDKFQAWLGRQPKTVDPRITLVSQDTAIRSAAFIGQIEGAKRRPKLPEDYRDFSIVERKVRVLDIVSELGHMDIVTSGRVLPVLLHRTPLKAVKPPKFLPPKKLKDL
jgi:hypothetical protein